jgi:biopolymer transport protein ExbD
MASHMVIAVLKDGRMVVGGESVSEQALQEKLEKIYKENPQTMVVVQADKTVEHHRVVRAMDLAATVGLKRLAIATVQE